MFIVMVIGEKRNLTSRFARTRADEAATIFRTMPRDYIVELTIQGFDDDPREIWDIPEARDYFIEFCERLEARGVQSSRILPQSLDVLRGCQATQDGKTVAVRGTQEDTIREGVEQVLAHLRRQPS